MCLLIHHYGVIIKRERVGGMVLTGRKKTAEKKALLPFPVVATSKKKPTSQQQLTAGGWLCGCSINGREKPRSPECWSRSVGTGRRKE